MNSLQTAAFVILWAVLVTLACLVFLLYRQVDKAYRGSAAVDSGGLLPGVHAPDIHILSDGQTVGLGFPGDDEFYLLAFVNSGCVHCEKLMSLLARGEYPGKMIVLLKEGAGFPEIVPRLPPTVEFHALAYPYDAGRDFGVTVVPLIYALRGRTILSVQSVSSKERLEALLRQAADNEETLIREEESTHEGADLILVHSDTSELER